MSKQLYFRYPFEGKPTPVPMLGFFCYRPTVYLKLFGLPMVKALAELGLKNQYRRLTRFSAEPNQKLLLKTLREMVAAFPISMTAPEVMADLAQTIDGCPEARRRVNELSFTETLFLGMDLARNEWQRRHVYLVLLERTGLQALSLFNAGDVKSAVAYMKEHPLVRTLLWPEALEVLDEAADSAALLPLTVAMSLDAHLGWLAAWDLDDSENRGLMAPQFACLLPTLERPGRNPTSLLFDELQRRAGAATVSELLDGGARLPELDVGTLYRWSAGTHFPDADTLTMLMAAHQLNDPKDILYRQFAAAKLINLIGFLSQEISVKVAERGATRAGWPWPAYPVGHPSFEAWMATRYPFWLNYHRANENALAELARA
jgi:hypothetical protein